MFRSVGELVTAIEQYVSVHNKDPKRFVWTAKANDILQKVIRVNSRLSSKQNEALHSRMNHEVMWHSCNAIVQANGRRH